jgi:hypothetical protein
MAETKWASDERKLSPAGGKSALIRCFMLFVDSQTTFRMVVSKVLRMRSTGT